MAAKEPWLKARLRKRDKDIIEELTKRELAYGEIADMVREGFRMVLFDQYEKPKVLDPIFLELTEKSPDNPEDVEALIDDLIQF